LPLTLAVTQVLMVRTGELTYAIPSVLVEQVRKVQPHVLKSLYEEQKVELDGNTYPFFYLPAMLGDAKLSPESQSHNPLMLLRSGNQRVALHVDELLGNREVVVKNIGPQLAWLPGIAGATVLGNGRVVLILNPLQMTQRIANVALKTRKAEPVVIRTQHVVMVVDDGFDPSVAELTGKVVQIDFKPGSLAKAGEILVRQDTSSEEAQLRAAEAAATLAKLNMDRFGRLLSERTIAQSQFDNAEATLKQAAAQADTIRASIAKKTIRAPFSGRLGIRLVNLGQVINEGQPIVSLQALDPIFVDFSLPQQQLSLVQPGQTARLTSDALPGEVVEGKITAINPQVDAATRNIRVQATVANPRELLRPGMFVNVSVVLPVRQPVLAIPATAVLYAPYSDSVFVVEEKVSEKSGQPAKVVRQQFAQLGEKRGDFVAVLSGLKAGDIVVSTGVFKLRNGQDVVVDNVLAPEFKLNPKPAEN